jgi:hypothetical protein
MSTPPTTVQVAAYSRHTRYLVFGLIVAVIIVGVLGTIGFVYAVRDRGIHIGRDSLTNEMESKNVEVLLGSEGIVVCSGVFIRPTGEILTAAHCFFATQTYCDFNTTLPGFPLAPEFSYYVEIMGVNRTREKYIFPFEVIASSPITDVLIIKPLPLVRPDGSVIRVVDQPYFRWDESQELERGDIVQSMAFDLAFLKKLSHKGPVQAVSKDRGTSFAVSVDQVFVDTGLQPGASGSGFFNNDNELILAPLSYRWDNSPVQGPYVGYLDRATVSVSGTSSRVSKPLTDRMLNPATPPNGAAGVYHIPSLGIVPYEVVSAVNLWDNWNGGTYYPWLQNRGIIFVFLASQAYFEFVTTSVTECLLPPYTVTPPSLLNAPLDEALSGTPPDPMIDFPGGGTFGMPGSYMIILEAIERHLDHHDWHYLGEDAGLDTVTGILIGSHKWVGDVVRVRIRAIDPAAPTDPTHNWEAIYRVTLQAIDPFWDSIFTDVYSNYVAYLRLNTTNPSAPQVYLDPAAIMPTHIKSHRGRDTGAALPNSNRNALARDIVTLIPEGVNVYSLPTLAEAFSSHMLSKRQAPLPARLDKPGHAPAAAALHKKPPTKTVKSAAAKPLKRHRPAAAVKPVPARHARVPKRQLD